MKGVEAMKYLLTIALFFLAILWPSSAAQELHFNGGRSVSSGLTGVRKNDHTIRALLKAQLKCLDEISARRLAGESPKRECPDLDKMIEETPLHLFVRYEIQTNLSQEEINGIKYAILEAAYFGYINGSKATLASRKER
jgi:hypothetical protein